MPFDRKKSQALAAESAEPGLGKVGRSWHRPLVPSDGFLKRDVVLGKDGVLRWELFLVEGLWYFHVFSHGFTMGC